MLYNITKGGVKLEIYERIRHLRKDHLHQSQTEFGKKLGVNRDVINNIENDRLAKPEQKVPLYKLICKEFHVRESWLIDGDGDDPFSYDLEEDEFSSYVAEIDQNDPRLKQAILYYKKLSEEDRELFWNFMDRFVLKKEPEE